LPANETKLILDTNNEVELNEEEKETE
jgi:hypothetical protein